MTVADGPPDPMAHLVDREGFETWLAMLHVHARLLVTLERETKMADGFTLAGYEALAILNVATDGRLRMQDLAVALVTSKSGATRTVAALEQEGLVRRVIPAENRRTTYAVITDEGRAAFRRAAPGFFDRVHDHFGRHLHAGDAKLIQAFCARVADSDIGHYGVPRPGADPRL